MAGLIGKSIGLMPTPQDESEDQPAQNMEEALKRKRQKMALDKLHIIPEDSDL